MAYDWSKINAGYYDKKNNFRKDLILTEADSIGKLLAQGEKKKNKLSSSQLRNFYNEVKALDARINEENFESNLPLIFMLKSKASYAYRGGGRGHKIPKSFYSFMNTNIDIIKTSPSFKTFKGFVTFFETVVGYFYGYGGESNR